MLPRLRCRLPFLLIVILQQGAASLAADDAPARSPNIVLILADDLGWTDLGCQGSRYYESPHIDRLAREGLTHSSFYACQNCAPTRAALMSGQYAPRTGVYTVGSFDRGKAQNRLMTTPQNLTTLPLDKRTLAESLQAAGYATGMFGKWHLGNGEGFHPSDRGFDEAIVSNGRHFKIRTNPPRDVDPDVYLADYLTDLAVDFIERHAERPFFLYLPHFAVHTPIQAKQEWIDYYRQKEPVEGHNNPTYAAMIHSVDESVGRVLAALDEHALADETLVIFMSDNGGLGGYRIPGTERRKGITDNWPLRAGKGALYEGGVRVPFLVRWPGNIPAGSRTETPGVHVDLYPTLLELAGLRPQEAVPADQPLDGVSLLTLWQAPGEPFERPPIYWHFPGYLQSYIPEDVWRTTPVSVIRDGDWKLLEFFEDGRRELYNLNDDLSEERDLAEQHPERVQALHEQLVRWREASGALMPTPKDSQR